MIRLAHRANIDALLHRLRPQEQGSAVCDVDVYERGSLPGDDADEHRRRVLARQL